EGIAEFRQAAIGPARRPVDLGGALHGKRFVGTLGVELGDEGIELGLLLEAVHAWGPGGFLLERQMHALMASVLLGPAWLDALDLDAEPEPPDGQPAQIEQGIGGGERDAIVGADAGWQAALLEQAFEGRKSQVFPRGLERLAEQQIARGVIGDGEGIAVGLVAELELTLVIGAP